MTVVTMRQLLESGVHFGHQTRRWNPKMKRYIFTDRNGIYIIDLQQSLSYIDRAYEYVRETVAHGGSVLFVGTKKQGQEAIREQATRVGMPYVTERWLGGMLTNHQTIYKSVQKLDEIEAMMNDGRMENFSKKEQLEFSRTFEKLNTNLGGIRKMKGVPEAVFVVDTAEEETAVREANKLGIPVIGIVDTNCDPTLVRYPIPGNDDAIRAISLFTRVVAESIEEGRKTRAEGKDQGVDMAEAPAKTEGASATLAGDDATVATEAAEAAEGSESKPAG
jgi:small subunit ribosomal protein S2